MKGLRKDIATIVSAALFVFVAAHYAAAAEPADRFKVPTYLKVSGSESFIEEVAFAIDGDTIRFEDGTRIRLEGVAAPENNEPGGTEATQFMKRLVNGNSLRCDLNGQRSYNRLVGICYLGGDDIGAAIIAAGLARDYPRFSGGRYASFETPAARQLVLPRYCRP